MGTRLAGALIAIVVVLGMKFYGKASAHDDVKARLVELCEGNAGCLSAVEAHYDACFDGSYKMGGRRRSSKLDVDGLVACVNRAAGKTYFAVDQDAR